MGTQIGDRQIDLSQADRGLNAADIVFPSSGNTWTGTALNIMDALEEVHLWLRTGTLLAPLTTNDTMDISVNALGTALTVDLDLPSNSGGTNTAFLLQLNSATDQDDDTVAAKIEVNGTNIVSGDVFGVSSQVTNTQGGVEGNAVYAAISGAANVNAVKGLATGTGTTSYGLYGSSTGVATTNYGVYGTASGASTNWAGYFSGDVNITGKLTVAGLIDPTGLKLAEQASDPGSTAAGEGTIWVKNDAPSKLMFTDDIGSDVEIVADSGLWDKTGTVLSPRTSTDSLTLTPTTSAFTAMYGVNLTVTGASNTGEDFFGFKANISSSGFDQDGGIIGIQYTVNAVSQTAGDVECAQFQLTNVEPGVPGNGLTTTVTGAGDTHTALIARASGGTSNYSAVFSGAVNVNGSGATYGPTQTQFRTVTINSNIPADVGLTGNEAAGLYVSMATAVDQTEQITAIETRMDCSNISQNDGVGIYSKVLNIPAGKSGTGLLTTVSATTATSSATGIRATASGSGGAGGAIAISGTGSGATVSKGVEGTTSSGTTGYGVKGAASAVTTAYGGHFSTTGAGVTNYGIYASATGGTTNWAGYFTERVYVESATASSTFYAENTATGAGANPYGVQGSIRPTGITQGGAGVYGNYDTGGNLSFQGIGVYGEVGNGNEFVVAAMIGVKGHSDGGGGLVNGYGGWFTSTGSDALGYGVKAEADSAATNYGVHGTASGSGTANYGLYGIVSGAATTNYGIYATASGASTNWAGYFSGDVNITGKLTVAGLIDPTGLKLAEQASDPGSTAAGEGTIWVKNDSPNAMMFTDDAGTDYEVASSTGIGFWSNSAGALSPISGITSLSLTTSNSSSNFLAHNIQNTVNNSSGSVSNISGLEVQSIGGMTGTGTIQEVVGIEGKVSQASSNVATTLRAISSYVHSSGTGNVGELVGFYSYGQVEIGATVSKYKAFEVGGVTNLGTLTDGYGLYLSDISGAATNTHIYCTTGMIIRAAVQDGASAEAFAFDTQMTLAATGAKLFSISNAGVEKSNIDKDGGAFFGGNIGVGIAQSTTWGGFNASLALSQTDGNSYIATFSNATAGAANYIGIFQYDASPYVLAIGSSTYYYLFALDPTNGVVGMNVEVPTSTFSCHISPYSISRHGLLIKALASQASGTRMLKVEDSSAAELFAIDQQGKVWGTCKFESNAVAAADPAISFNTENTITSGTLMAIGNNGVRKFTILPEGQIYCQGSTPYIRGYETLRTSSNYGAISYPELSTIQLTSNMVDGASALAVKINTSSTYSTIGAKIISFQNGSSEKAYIDKDGGGYFANDSGIGSAPTSGTLLTINSADENSWLTKYSNTTAGASNYIATWQRNASPYLFSFGSNNSYYLLTIDGVNKTVGINVVDPDVPATNYSLDIHTVGSANGVRVESNGDESTRAWQFHNGTSEVMYIAGDGSIRTPSITPIKIESDAADNASMSILSVNSVNAISLGILASFRNQDAYKLKIHGQGELECLGTGTTYLKGFDEIQSEVVDGASAVGLTIDTVNAFSTGGAKLLSVQTNSVEKMSVDKDGGIKSEAGVMTLAETTTPTPETNYGKIYTKSDNKLYFQDGSGVEKEIAFV